MTRRNIVETLDALLELYALPLTRLLAEYDVPGLQVLIDETGTPTRPMAADGDGYADPELEGRAKALMGVQDAAVSAIADSCTLSAQAYRRLGMRAIRGERGAIRIGAQIAEPMGGITITREAILVDRPYFRVTPAELRIHTKPSTPGGYANRLRDLSAKGFWPVLDDLTTKDLLRSGRHMRPSAFHEWVIHFQPGPALRMDSTLGAAP